MTKPEHSSLGAASVARRRTFLRVSNVLRRLPPFTFARLKTRALRACGLSMGKSSAVWGMPTFSGPLSPLDALSLGNAVGINAGCHFELFERIHLEDDVSIGHDVLFVTRTFARNGGDGITATMLPITVRKGAWVGARATVLAGVTIGEGAVVGAQVVVTKDVPPHTMMTGNRQLSLAKWR